MEEMNDDELDQDREYWEGMITQATTKLPVYRNMLTQQIIKAIHDRTDRDRAVHLSKKVFDLEYRKDFPEEYESGMKEFNEIIARHGANNGRG